MPTIVNPLQAVIPQLTPVALLDILVVAFLVYQLLMIIRGRRAANILVGVLLVLAAYALVTWMGLELVRAILANIAPFAPFALIVLFQSEIRRLLARLGGRRWISAGGRLQTREFAEELVLALSQLAENKIGALVVVERDIGLRTFVETGVLMDSHVSRDLILTIFLPGSALHDGAVIIRGDRIAAAACFLPLTVRPALARHLGTRHRAAIGVTEEADCLSLVVSEETGRISVAAFGEIELDVTSERVEQRITDHLTRRGSAPSEAPKPTPQSNVKQGAARDAHTD
jgi:diadenylate cyclase